MNFKISKGTLASLLILGSCLIGLAAVFPYSAGYGPFRRSILSTASDNWLNSNDSTWQHGILAPFIALWLCWHYRHELQKPDLRPSSLGLALLLFALFSYYVGYRSNNIYFGYIALQLMPLAAVAWLFSWAHVRKLAIAWIVLLYTWPLLFLAETLGFSLRLIMVKSASWVLETLHAPIFREGTSFISAPTATEPAGSWLRLNVEGACSGMRSLFALMIVSTLFSWFNQPTHLRRLTLFITSIPLAVLGNMARIFLLIGGSALFGQEFAVGDEQIETSKFHFFTGLVVFLITVLGLQWVSKQMHHFFRKKKHAVASLPNAVEA